MSGKNKNGFTLIELLVVIAIIGILSTLAIVALSGARQKARDSKRVADVNQMSKALELYYNDNNGYPTLITGGQPLKSPDGSITYMSSVPMNPSPRTDGNCPNKDYGYGYSTLTNKYAIEFCLGSTVNSTGAGSNLVTPDGMLGGLTQYYTFEEGSGSPAVSDRAGSLNGTWHGGGAHYTATAKIGNYAGSFNGTADYVSMTNASYTNSTFSAWVYRTSLAGMLENVISGGGACQYPALRSLTLQNYYGPTVAWQGGYTAPVINTWYHVAMSFSGATGEYKIYLNGVREQAGTGSSYTNCSVDTIGAISAGNDRFFTGYIDDVRVYNRVLSEAEIKAIYAAGN